MHLYLFEVIHAASLLDPVLTVKVATPDGDRVRDRSGVTVVPDFAYEEVNPGTIGCLLVPGGNPDMIAENAHAKQIVRDILADGGVVAGICAGVVVLALAGVLRGRRVAHNYTARDVPLEVRRHTDPSLGRSRVRAVWLGGRRRRDHGAPRASRGVRGSRCYGVWSRTSPGVLAVGALLRRLGQTAMHLIRSEPLPIVVLEPPDYVLLRDYYLENKDHLAPWEPARDEAYYSATSMRDLVAERHRQFLQKTALHLCAIDDGRMVAECNFTNIVRGPFQACNMGFSVAKSKRGPRNHDRRGQAGH